MGPGNPQTDSTVKRALRAIEELQAKIDDLGKQAVESKKNLDFTIQREADIFKSLGGPRMSLAQSGEIAGDFVDEAITRGRFA